MCALFSKSSVEKPPLAPPTEILDFQFYRPAIPTGKLIPGIDNIRFDVSLSPKFLQACKRLVLQLILQYSEGTAELMSKPPALAKAAERKDFKQQLHNLLSQALNRANTAKNPQLELLARAALVKALADQMQEQYAFVVLQAREKLKVFDSPSHANRARGYQLQEVLGTFQRDKKIILRNVGQELIDMMDAVCGDVIRKTRDSFFGSEASESHSIFSHPLLFSEDGKDEYLCLQHYVMLGNFQRDADRVAVAEQQVCEFLEWADSGSPEAQVLRAAREKCDELTAHLQTLRGEPAEVPAPRRLFPRARASRQAAAPAADSAQISAVEAELQQEQARMAPLEAAFATRLREIMRYPDNASLLVDYIETGRQLSALEKENGSNGNLLRLQQKAERQRERLEVLYQRFMDAGLLPYIAAAYECAKIYQQFCPPLNPQQLKNALLDPIECKKAAHLLQEYGVSAASVDAMEESARRAADTSARDGRAIMVRFLKDFFRLQQDLRKMQLLRGLLERIHLPSDPKQRELSEINNTLYHVLMPEEEKPLEEKVTSHVILKADIRDSTSITAQLLARSLNPASYFSLNFFEPVRKLLPRFGANKVFLEGDALILSIMESESDTSTANSVARACSLAREMIEGLRVVNDRAAQNQLPLLEFGIGISFQSSAPMYLMDGDRPIMISKALNESDRLSSCGKLARQLLTQKSRFFNVFLMQLLPEAESRGASDEFLVRYNVQGIEINEAAFEKLCRELSMTRVELKLPVFTEPELVELYCGSLPLGAQSFQKIVVRRGRVPQLDPKTLRVVEHTTRYYYEVCTARPIYDFASKQLGWN